MCPVLRAPSAGPVCPTTRLLGEFVGQVTHGFLWPTTEPQRGAWGVWPEGLVDGPRGSQVALHRVADRLWASHSMEGPGAC